MSQQFKLLFSLLLTALAVAPLIATSDTPSSSSSSSSSSSLTANMSDAAESIRTKRKAVGSFYDETEAEERIMHAQKTLRSSNSPSIFSMADDLSEQAPSSALIARNSLMAPLYLLSAPIAPINRAGNIPSWFYAHEHSLLKFTFEYLNYADLTLARRVSKAFHATAPQVIMPRGQKWITWCIDRMNRAKNPDSRVPALKEIISATGRCPNAMVNLRQIVEGYFEHVPGNLRFWTGGRKYRQLVSDKDELRNDLGKILDRITQLEAEHQKDRETVKQQSPKSTVEKDLAALIVLQEKALAPLREEKQKIVDLLVPALNALFPYELANTILDELDVTQGLPEHLPLVHKSLPLDSLSISALAKKRNVTRNSVSCLAAACLPSAHASLFALTNDIICLDKPRRVAQHHMEKRFRDKVIVHEFDPITCLYTDLVDTKYYQIKIEQLREALKNVILKERSILKNVIELNLGAMESDYYKFICDRVEKYLGALKKPDQSQKDAISNHVLGLITLTLDIAHDSELDACRKRVSTVIHFSWYEFFQKLNRLDYWARAAHFAARAVALAGNKLTANDLKFAAMLHFNANAFTQAAQYYDQFFTEFMSDAEYFDFIRAGRFSAYLGEHGFNDAEAERHYKAATEKLVKAVEKLNSAPLHLLKTSFKDIGHIRLPRVSIQRPHAQAFEAQLQKCRAAIAAKIDEIERPAALAAQELEREAALAAEVNQFLV